MALVSRTVDRICSFVQLTEVRCGARVVGWILVCLDEHFSSLRCGFLTGNILYE